MSVVTTGGGLLFAGDVAGRFRAFDQRTGQILWETNLGSQVTGFPVSFAVGERQYIAVSTGSAVNAGGYLALTPELKPTSSNNIYIFALPQNWQTARNAQRPAAPTPRAAPATPMVAASVPASTCRKPVGQKPAVDNSYTFTISAGRLQQGKTLYVQQQCATCHGENLRGTPGAPALADAGFRSVWAGRSVQDLLECTRSTMPPGRGGSLSDGEYLALVSMMLDANGFDAGNQRNGLAWR
jgi:alcohol dehydrogenase (cytochrome c)